MRQPIHTVYGGAHLFKPDIAERFGRIALETLKAHSLGVGDAVYERVVRKLEREPIEDYRIDFEDGYGVRSDSEEDEHAIAAAKAARNALNAPPFLGIRIKPLTERSRERAIRTLKLFLETLGDIPPDFVVTLPKVTDPAQVGELVRLLEPYGPKLELMIETPQAIFMIPTLLDAAEGRCRGIHFGPYDYTASCGIVAEHQSLTHPACDFARNVMLVTTAGRDVMLSDGPTNILPIAKSGNVQDALRLHFDNVQRGLKHGFYQGWDLHPAQLPARYAAVYDFFLQSFEPAAARLRNFIEQSQRATLVGGVFDDAATGEGLYNFFRRGLNCGAFSEDEIAQRGITLTPRE